MKVKRIICPACKSERNIALDKDDLHGYSEEIVYDVCGKRKCRKWYSSPEQRLLRALFGVPNK